jgi:hypothetical protein
MKMFYYPRLNTYCLFSDIIKAYYVSFEGSCPGHIQKYRKENTFKYETKNNVWYCIIPYEHHLEYLI